MFPCYGGTNRSTERCHASFREGADFRWAGSLILCTKSSADPPELWCSGGGGGVVCGWYGTGAGCSCGGCGAGGVGRGGCASWPCASPWPWPFTAGGGGGGAAACGGLNAAVAPDCALACW